MPLEAAQNGHRQRRRRLMAEEYSSAANELSTACSDRVGEPTPHKSENYGDALFLKQQRQPTDLVPSRPITLGLLSIGALAIVTALEMVYARMFAAAAGQTPAWPRLALFDLNSPGNLASWFSALLLLAAAAAAMVVYSVRRYRADDYVGRYRIWVWGAACCFLAATDVSTGLHQAFQEMMIALTGARLWGDGSLWWTVPWFFLFGAVGLRMLLDILPCRLATTGIVLAAICYSVAAAGVFIWIPTSDATRQALLREGGLMVGHVLLLLGIVLQARYVILDAKGLLPRRRAKAESTDESPADAGSEDSASEARKSLSRRASSRYQRNDLAKEPDDTEARESAASWTALDPPHQPAVPASAAKRPAEIATSAVVPRPSLPVVKRMASPAAPAVSESAGHKLSKAERKALKKRLIEERLDRQQNW
jgi:hypothetical protein